MHAAAPASPLGRVVWDVHDDAWFRLVPKIAGCDGPDGVVVLLHDDEGHGVEGGRLDGCKTLAGGGCMVTFLPSSVQLTTRAGVKLVLW